MEDDVTRGHAEELLLAQFDKAVRTAVASCKTRFPHVGGWNPSMALSFRARLNADHVALLGTSSASGAIQPDAAYDQIAVCGDAEFYSDWASKLQECFASAGGSRRFLDVLRRVFQVPDAEAMGVATKRLGGNILIVVNSASALSLGLGAQLGTMLLNGKRANLVHYSGCEWRRIVVMSQIKGHNVEVFELSPGFVPPSVMPKAGGIVSQPITALPPSQLPSHTHGVVGGTINFSEIGQTIQRTYAEMMRGMGNVDWLKHITS